MTTPLVSIIIPVYNVSDYIGQCITSVMRQSYPHIECIIVDDKTPDNSIVICEQLLSTYQGPIRFNILHHEMNRGLSAARNTGTHASSGEWIYYLDSDDHITPHCIEILVKEAITHPECDLVTAKAVTNPPSNDLDYPCFNQYQHHTDNIWLRKNYFCQKTNYPIASWNKLINRQFIYNNQLFFKEGVIHEDLLWSFYVAQKVRCHSILTDTTYFYTIRPNSIMTGQSEHARGPHYMTILPIMAADIKEPYFMLQVCHIYTYFMRWNRYVHRTLYRPLSRQLTLLLFKKGKILWGLLNYIYFNIKGGKRLKFIYPYLNNKLNKEYRKA